MSHPRNPEALHSLNMISQAIVDATQPSAGKCGGDCSNCPCSGEEPKSTKKTHEDEASDPCDKC